MNPYLQSEESETSSETSSELAERKAKDNMRGLWVQQIADCVCILCVITVTGLVGFVLYLVLKVI